MPPLRPRAPARRPRLRRRRRPHLQRREPRHQRPPSVNAANVLVGSVPVADARAANVRVEPRNRRARRPQRPLPQRPHLRQRRLPQQEPGLVRHRPQLRRPHPLRHRLRLPPVSRDVRRHRPERLRPRAPQWAHLARHPLRLRLRRDARPRHPACLRQRPPRWAGPRLRRSSPAPQPQRRRPAVRNTPRRRSRLPSGPRQQ